jgi:hypothetical protein
MYRSELPYFITFAILILSIPIIPSKIILLFDSLIIRIAIIFGLLFLISIGPTAAIFGLILIALIYLERNKIKIIEATKKIDLMDVDAPQQMTVKQESVPQKTVPVLDFNIPPRDDEMPYLPSDDCNSDNFSPVAPSINMKNALNTITPGSSTNDFYEENGFGHVEGVETLSS